MLLNKFLIPFFVQVDNTAIHVAAGKGHYNVLQLLLQVAFEKSPGIIGKLNKVQVFTSCIGQ